MFRSLILVLLILPVSVATAERKAVFPSGGIKPVGPYSPGILAGDLLYVSGQGARDSTGNMASDPAARVRQCLNNVKAIVEGAGLTMEHIVYSQVYLHSSVSYDVLNQVWKEFFPKNPPARATLGVYRMPTDTTVEINAVAVRSLAQKKPVTAPSFPKDAPIAAGILTADRLFISGLLGRDPKSGHIPQDPAAQVQLALDRMKEVLQAAGLDFRHVVFVNPYLTPALPLKVMNEVYAKHFEFGNTPARATITVSFLPHNANIEFTAVAVRDLNKRRAVRPKNMAPSPTASPCVWAASTLYCSAKAGFIPGPNGGIFADRVEDQVRQTMRNLLDGLEEAGLDFSHVVASNVYLDNIDDFAKMNAVYSKYFPAEAPPTRTTVAPLPPVERVRSDSGHFPKLEEISLIAVKETARTASSTNRLTPRK
ncbi:MAG: Rid family hydrolase [Bryobacteraceae bacterium]|nr:Rid family hydrolase [Bryobacteraceae bacterium]MDW8378421.1 RidA family protein [Bryobacterales bacterium]